MLPTVLVEGIPAKDVSVIVTLNDPQTLCLFPLFVVAVFANSSLHSLQTGGEQEVKEDQEKVQAARGWPRSNLPWVTAVIAVLHVLYLIFFGIILYDLQMLCSFMLIKKSRYQRLFF